MQVKELYEFVKLTDVSRRHHSQKERLRIAILGLSSETGSVLAALKKANLAGGIETSNLSSRLVRGELKEEIGDALWYAVMLAQVYAELYEDPRANDIFTANILMLQDQLSGRKLDQRRVQKKLGLEKVEAFQKKAEGYLSKEPSIDVYQETAMETARTSETELREVCVVILQQLSAQVSRELLPEVEHALNHEIRPKDAMDAASEMVWHLSALASLYGIKLSESMDVAIAKAKFRNVSGESITRHDAKFPEIEQFPQTMTVRFRDVKELRSEVDWKVDGVWEPLGDHLENNYAEDDAYRYHDVMHLAFIVYLGWSPVFRKFMNRKRNTEFDDFDESVEDGGRAKVLEESLILQIHTLAERLRKYILEGDTEKASVENYDASVFDLPGSIGFDFLKKLHDETWLYEVYKNSQQDWEAAIREGYRVFTMLRKGTGGIVTATVFPPSLTYTALPN